MKTKIILLIGISLLLLTGCMEANRKLYLFDDQVCRTNGTYCHTFVTSSGGDVFLNFSTNDTEFEYRVSQ